MHTLFLDIPILILNCGVKLIFVPKLWKTLPFRYSAVRCIYVDAIDVVYVMYKKEGDLSPSGVVQAAMPLPGGKSDLGSILNC